MHTTFRSESLKERNRLNCLCIGGRIIFKLKDVCGLGLFAPGWISGELC
jgi:hypothetical protein